MKQIYLTLANSLLVARFLTVLGHLNRGLPEKGEQVSVQTESEFGIRVDKFTRLLQIIG